MVIAKKIIAWALVTSFLFTHFSFSYANSESITSEEKTKIDAEVLKLQWQLLNNSQNFFQKLTSDFKKITHYEESWDSKIEFEIDQSMLWKWFATLDMKNYAIKNALLDSDISSDVSLKTRFQPTYGTGVELDLSTILSMISKDGDMYTLLKDFNFQVNDDNLKEILEKLKEQFKDNKYLKLPSDPNSQAFYQYINNFRWDTFFLEAQKILSMPLFQAYQKSGDKYLLIPTKFACDTYFELDKKLNFYNSWYTPKTCSQTVYKSFIKEFLSIGQIYLILWEDNNTFWYESKNDETQISFTINYNSENILALDFDITPDQTKFKNEGFHYSYVKWESITSKFNAENGRYIWTLDAKLDSNNHLISLDSKVNFANDFVWSFSIINKKISWFYTIKERWYDYESEDWDYILKNIYGVSISGKLNNDNILEKLNIKAAWVDVQTKEIFLQAKSSYENGNYAFDISSQWMYSTFEMSAVGFMSKEKFKIDSEYNFNEIYTGDFNMDYDTSNNKNNLDVYFDINEIDKKIVKFIVKNVATRNYKEDISIKIPTDFQELDTYELYDLLNY